MSAPRWRGVLVAVAIFFLGAAVGVAGAVVIGKRALRNALTAAPAATGPLERAANRVGNDLAKRLDLDRESASRVQTELNLAAGRMKLVRLNSARQIREDLRATIQRIEADLPPGKQAEFRKIIAERFDRVGIEALQAPASGK